MCLSVCLFVCLFVSVLEEEDSGRNVGLCMCVHAYVRVRLSRVYLLCFVSLLCAQSGKHFQVNIFGKHLCQTFPEDFSGIYFW